MADLAVRLGLALTWAVPPRSSAMKLRSGSPS